MATWKVTTADKKSVEEHEFWEKDGIAIRRITGFRWGTWYITTTDDNEPELDKNAGPFHSDENCIDMNNTYGNNIEDVELDSLVDGWYGDVIWPDDMPEEERERLEELWEEDSYEAWEGEGWVQTETECWVYCDLNIEKVEDYA